MLRPLPPTTMRPARAQQETPKLPPADTRRPTSLSGFQLERQPADVMNTILLHLDDSELGRVALHTNQAMLGTAPTHRPHAWLAAIESTCRIRARAAGALGTPTAAIVTGPQGAPVEGSWAVTWSRHTRVPQALSDAHAAMSPTDYAGAPVPLGNTALVMAFDALDHCSAASPDVLRRGAEKALALGQLMDAAISSTPIAHLLRAVALARLGHVGQAEAWLAEHLSPVLERFLQPGHGNGGHPFYGRARIHTTEPSQALELLKNVALETQSVRLFDIFLAAARHANLPVNALERESIVEVGRLYDAGHVQMLGHVLHEQRTRYRDSASLLKQYILEVPPILQPGMTLTVELQQRWAACRTVVKDFLADAKAA